MSGYQLSARAAATEQRWTLERKDVQGLDLVVGRSDRDNFVTNRVTTEAYDDNQRSSRAAALGLSATWACVSFWAGNIASLPVTIQRPGPGGVAVEDRSHPLHDLLHDSPNYDQSAFDFWEFMAASIELHGNAYAEIITSDRGVLVALEPILRPECMQVRRLGNRDLEYRWTADGRTRVETQQRILHVRGFGGSALGGVSPLAACRASFASAATIDRAAAAMFANGVQASGLLKSDKVLSGDQRKVLEDLLVEKFVGARNAGRPMLLDNGLTWEQLTIDPHDAEMLESRRFSVEDICRVFEVDPHLVGQTVGNTTLGSSITEQTNSVMKFKMRKRLKRFEGALGKQLLTRADRRAGIAIRFNVEAFLRADSAGRADFYQKMERYMTVNEVRAKEGLGPIAGGDVLYRQMQGRRARPVEPHGGYAGVTTIATDGVSMAGDGARFRNEIMVATGAPKVNRLRDGSLLGCSGASADCIAFREWIEAGQGSKRPKAGSLSALHLLPDGELHYYSEAGPAIVAEHPATIGSGSELALGAMLAGASPGEAVRIAATRDPYTGGTIIVEVL